MSNASTRFMQSFKQQKIVQDVWETKYKFGDEKTPIDSFKRVSRAVFDNEKKYGLSPERIEELVAASVAAMVSAEWVPGGRIQAGAGTGKNNVTLLNCFVNQKLDDSMQGIFAGLTEAGLTLREGGGMGTDFSTLRPSGAPVEGVGADASGPLSFMDMWDAMSRTVKSAGKRRGAMMGTLACWHPDVEKFVEAKQTKDALTQFNVSVLITDDFMEAVKTDDDWQLRFPKSPTPTNGHSVSTIVDKDNVVWYVWETIKARDLWRKIIKSTYEYAEPGVIFIERVNKQNNLYYCEEISASNPCWSGDTEVWTVDGKVRFNELDGVKNVKVFTQGAISQNITVEKMVNPGETSRRAHVVKLILEAGRQEYIVLRCTPNHNVFKVEDFGAWTKTEVQNLERGDKLFAVHHKSVDGFNVGETQFPTVVGVLDDPDEYVPVYNGMVEHTHTYFVSCGENLGLLSANCGEQMLPPRGDCCLGHVNLAVMVKKPFTKDAFIDLDRIEEIVRLGVRFLDNVLDISHYPIYEQYTEAQNKRRIGIGVTGLANMLQQRGYRYGSGLALQVTERVMKRVRDAVYSESIELAKEKGVPYKKDGQFPLFDKDKFLAAPFVQTLPDYIKEGIAEHGIRNGLLLSIAPVGTNSLYYGNVSSGIEPVYNHKYKRKILNNDGSHEHYTVYDYGYLQYAKHLGVDVEEFASQELPDFMVTTDNITVEEHIRTQAICQKYVDASISKTINCPKSMTFEEFEKVYDLAYELGCKGCTTYRPSDINMAIRGSVLENEEQSDKSNGSLPAKPNGQIGSFAYELTPRSKALNGRTYKLSWHNLDRALYVTINDEILEDGTRRPYEIFVNSVSVEGLEWRTALTRMLSAIFRRGGDVDFVVDELRSIFSSTGGQRIDMEFIPSLVALIGKTVGEHLTYIKEYNEMIKGGLAPIAARKISVDIGSIPVGVIEGYSVKNLTEGLRVEVQHDDSVEITNTGIVCSKCNCPSVVEREGCRECLACGYNECG